MQFCSIVTVSVYQGNNWSWVKKLFLLFSGSHARSKWTLQSSLEECNALPEPRPPEYAGLSPPTQSAAWGLVGLTCSGFLALTRENQFLNYNTVLVQVGFGRALIQAVQKYLKGLNLRSNHHKLLKSKVQTRPNSGWAQIGPGRTSPQNRATKEPSHLQTEIQNLGKLFCFSASSKPGLVNLGGHKHLGSGLRR